jgi:hypothetical protein
MNKTNKVDYNEKLEEFYGEIPDYVVGAGKTYIKITTSDVITEEAKDLKITIEDVTNYYANDARNISSGIRGIAGHYGDWRPIDNLAKEALSWFKFVNREGLNREAKKHGMELAN